MADDAQHCPHIQRIRYSAGYNYQAALFSSLRTKYIHRPQLQRLFSYATPLSLYLTEISLTLPLKAEETIFHSPFGQDGKSFITSGPTGSLATSKTPTKSCGLTRCGRGSKPASQPR